MRLRVAEVLPTLRRAGAEQVAVALACGLPRDRFDTAVVTLYGAEPEDLGPVLSERGIPCSRLGKRAGPDLRMWPRLRRVFLEYQPNIIHTHSYTLRYVRRVAGPAAVVHTLHNLAGKDPDRLTAWLDHSAFRRGVAAVAVSGVVARSFELRHGRSPAATIPNGVDLSRFNRPGACTAWRRAHGFADSDVLVASVARLEPQKDPEGLVRAFAAASASVNPSWRLLLAGEGSLREPARECVRRLNMAAQVRFLGVLADVADLLCAADLFALASRWEGNPLSVMEAMAAGLPVVATAVGGVPELVEDGVTGVLVEPGRPEALARAMAELAGNAGRRRAMGCAARARAARFGVDAMVSAYAGLFERLAGGRR